MNQTDHSHAGIEGCYPIRTMKRVLLMLLATFVTLSVVAAEPSFNCVLTSDRTSYTVGETPALAVTITNKSGKEVVLVGSLDGSDVGWRFPKCRVEIFDAAGKPVTAAMGRCGNMNVLRLADFVVVPAGGAFNPCGPGFFSPHQFHRFPVSAPGDYTVCFYYSTSDRVEDYFGDERMMGKTNAAPEIQRMFKRVPKIELKSNQLKLKFLPKPK
jgi:hypothetical protein